MVFNGIIKVLLTKKFDIERYMFDGAGTHPPFQKDYKSILRKVVKPKYYYQSNPNVIGTRFEGFVKRITTDRWIKTADLFNPENDVWVFLASGQPHMAVGSQFNHWVTNGEEIIEVIGCYYMPTPSGSEWTYDILRPHPDWMKGRHITDWQKEEIQKVLEMIVNDNESNPA